MKFAKSAGLVPADLPRSPAATVRGSNRCGGHVAIFGSIFHCGNKVVGCFNHCVWKSRRYLRNEVMRLMRIHATVIKLRVVSFKIVLVQ
jgi:hypothetical protein